MALPESFDVVETLRALAGHVDELQAANEELLGRVAALERGAVMPGPDGLKEPGVRAGQNSPRTPALKGLAERATRTSGGAGEPDQSG